MRRIAKVDANQHAIVKALRAVGCSVTHTHTLGCGFPDIAVGFRGRSYLLEIKSKKGALTKDELNWHLTWRGDAYVVRSVDDALAVLGLGGNDG